MIAVLQARLDGLWTRSQIRDNVLAGIVVGVVALPLAMAFSIASGARPEQGIYTSIVAGVLTSLFGGTRVQIAGPTGAFIAVLSIITAQHGIGGLQIATLMAGVILVAFGFARLGAVIKYIPNPVIVGFTAGIAVIIFIGQWKDFFGLSPGPSGLHFHEKVWSLIQALPTITWTTTGLALLALLILTLGPRYLRRIPAPLVALVIVTLAQSVFHFKGVATIGSAYGGIPRTLPSFAFPQVTVAQVFSLVGPAFTIALLGAIESLLSAVVADGMAGTRHDSNQELIGQGIANIAAPLFGGFAATGAVARTATNIRNGATSPLAGVVHSGFLILVILVLAPLASAIPLCVLSAVLFVVAWNMSELPHAVRLVRTSPRTDVAVLLLTFLLTVFVDLVVAVNVGVIVAALLFMRRMADSVNVEQQLAIPSDTTGTAVRAPPHPAHCPVTRRTRTLATPITTPSAEWWSTASRVPCSRRRREARAHPRAHPKPATTLILRMGNVPFMDATGIIALEQMVSDFKRHGAVVLLVELKPNVRYKLERSGVIRLVGEEHVLATLNLALQLANEMRQPVST